MAMILGFEGGERNLDLLPFFLRLDFEVSIPGDGIKCVSVMQAQFVDEVFGTSNFEANSSRPFIVQRWLNIPSPHAAEASTFDIGSSAKSNKIDAIFAEKSSV